MPARNDNPREAVLIEELRMVFCDSNEAAAASETAPIIDLLDERRRDILVESFNELGDNERVRLIVIKGIGLAEPPSYRSINQEYGWPIGSLGPWWVRSVQALAEIAVKKGWQPLPYELFRIKPRRGPRPSRQSYDSTAPINVV